MKHRHKVTEEGFRLCESCCQHCQCHSLLEWLLYMPTGKEPMRNPSDWNRWDQVELKVSK